MKGVSYMGIVYKEKVYCCDVVGCGRKMEEKEKKGWTEIDMKIKGFSTTKTYHFCPEHSDEATKLAFGDGKPHLVHPRLIRLFHY